MSENKNTNESLIQTLTPIEIPKLKQPPTTGSTGMRGYATWVLRDAATGKVKQEGTSENMILGRGLDWIISHIVTGSWVNGSLAESSGASNTAYNAKRYDSLNDNYVVGNKDLNPFKYIVLLKVNSISGGNSVDFGEGKGNTTYKIHKCTTGDGIAGVDVDTYNERIGDSDTHNDTNSHSFGAASEISTRSKILGWKTVGMYPNYTDSQIGSGSSQSNTDENTQYFKRVSMVFNFGTNEANCNTGDTINSICWADSPECLCCGARLTVNPGIPKTNADTLDITYTFDLTLTLT